MDWLEFQSTLHEQTIAFLAAFFTLLAVVTALFVPLMLESSKRKEEQRRVASAFRADISAMLNMSESAQLKQSLTKMRDIFAYPKTGLEDRVRELAITAVFPATMYDLAGKDIGLLDQSVAERLICFYNALAGFRGSHGNAVGQNGLTLQGRVASIDYALKLFDEQLVSKAPDLIADLAYIAGRRWWTKRKLLASP